MRRLGRYKIIESLPSYGAVQPAVARRDGDIDLCVLKRLLVNVEAQPVAVGRFAREAKVVRRLEHPNIVRMLEAGETEGVRFISTEFIVGEDLSSIMARLKERGIQMPLDAFSMIAQGVLGGMEYAHRAEGPDGAPLQIVHRNLNPHCVVVSFTGEVKISDFGAVKASVDDFKTDPGMAVGTLEYMSPEQVLSKPLDQRSDLYAMGALFYEMLGGRRIVPDTPSTVMQTLHTIAHEEPVPLGELRPELPPRLVEAIERALKKRPANRWSTARAMSAAIRGALPPSSGGSAEALGRFMRALLPEGEKRAISMLKRIREVGTEDDEPQGNEEPTLVVEREAPGTSPEPMVVEIPEPSVMTMPGAVLTANRSLSKDAKKVMRQKAALRDQARLKKAARIQKIIYIGIVALAVVLGIAAWVVSVR